jgi:hypothetical protein
MSKLGRDSGRIPAPAGSCPHRPEPSAAERCPVPDRPVSVSASAGSALLAANKGCGRRLSLAGAAVPFGERPDATVLHLLVKRLQFGRRLNRQFSPEQFGTQFILAQSRLPLAGLGVESDERAWLSSSSGSWEQGLQPADGSSSVWPTAAPGRPGSASLAGPGGDSALAGPAATAQIRDCRAASGRRGTHPGRGPAGGAVRPGWSGLRLAQPGRRRGCLPRRVGD